MKKQNKSRLALLLAFFLVVGLLPQSAFAAVKSEITFQLYECDEFTRQADFNKPISILNSEGLTEVGELAPGQTVAVVPKLTNMANLSPFGVFGLQYSFTYDPNEMECLSFQYTNPDENGFAMIDSADAATKKDIDVFRQDGGEDSILKSYYDAFVTTSVPVAGSVPDFPDGNRVLTAYFEYAPSNGEEFKPDQIFKTDGNLGTFIFKVKNGTSGISVTSIDDETYQNGTKFNSGSFNDTEQFDNTMVGTVDRVVELATKTAKPIVDITGKKLNDGKHAADSFALVTGLADGSSIEADTVFKLYEQTVTGGVVSYTEVPDVTLTPTLEGDAYQVKIPYAVDAPDQNYWVTAKKATDDLESLKTLVPMVDAAKIEKALNTDEAAALPDIPEELAENVNQYALPTAAIPMPYNETLGYLKENGLNQLVSAQLDRIASIGGISTQYIPLKVDWDTSTFSSTTDFTITGQFNTDDLEEKGINLFAEGTTVPYIITISVDVADPPSGEYATITLNDGNVLKDAEGKVTDQLLDENDQVYAPDKSSMFIYYTFKYRDPGVTVTLPDGKNPDMTKLKRYYMKGETKIYLPPLSDTEALQTSVGSAEGTDFFFPVDNTQDYSKTYELFYEYDGYSLENPVKRTIYVIFMRGDLNRDSIINILDLQACKSTINEFLPAIDISDKLFRVKTYFLDKSQGIGIGRTTLEIRDYQIIKNHQNEFIDLSSYGGEKGQADYAFDSNFIMSCS